MGQVHTEGIGCGSLLPGEKKGQGRVVGGAIGAGGLLLRRFNGRIKFLSRKAG